MQSTAAPAPANVYNSGPVLRPLWARLSNDPALIGGPQNWDAGGVFAPSGVVKIGELFHMYYVGCVSGGNCGVGLATSTDGSTWNKVGNLIPPDGGGVTPPITTIGCTSMVHVNGRYHLYYSGFAGPNWRLYLATSSDGRAFSKTPIAGLC